MLYKRECQENEKTSHQERIFACETSDTGLLFKIFKELLQFSNEKIK